MTKEDKQGFKVLFVLIFIIAILVCITINAIRVKNIKYKYFKGEEIGISNQCYVDDENGCLCLIDGNFLAVDSYYRLDK